MVRGLKKYEKPTENYFFGVVRGGDKDTEKSISQKAHQALLLNLHTKFQHPRALNFPINGEGRDFYFLAQFVEAAQKIRKTDKKIFFGVLVEVMSG